MNLAIDCENPELEGMWVYGNLVARDGGIIQEADVSVSGDVVIC